MAKTVIETERVILREFTPHDAEGIFALNSNADVMKLTGAPLMQSIEQASNFLANYTEYATHGYGSWACVLKETGEFIGAFGLRNIKQKNMVGMGGLFLPQYWNKGYAVEIGKACIEYGFNVVGINEIIAMCAANHDASITVMEKLGMKYYEELENDGVKIVCYRIKKITYEQDYNRN